MSLKYIIKLDFGETDYYIRLNEQDWQEILNPRMATIFSDKKIALATAKEKTTFAEYAKAVSYTHACRKFDKWVKDGMVRREFNYPDPKLSRLYNDEPANEVLEWWWAIAQVGDFEIQQDHYSSWPDLFELFECLFTVESYYSESNDGTYRTVLMCIHKSTRLETFKRELALIEDRITYVDDNGNKVINIIDHFLSEYGNSVCFLIKQDGTYAIEDQYNEEIVSGTLTNVFKYWQKYRYYE